MDHSIEIDEYGQVSNLKEEIHKVAGIPPKAQRLVYSRREMLGYQTLDYLDVEAGQPVHCFVLPAEKRESRGLSMYGMRSEEERMASQGESSSLHLPQSIFHRASCQELSTLVLNCHS